jgi:hypothetical protein
MPCEFLRLDATVHVSPQSAASIRAPCRVATTPTGSNLTAGFLDFAEAASLPKATQSCFLGQAEEVFKGVDSRVVSIRAPYNRRQIDRTRAW